MRRMKEKNMKLKREEELLVVIVMYSIYTEKNSTGSNVLYNSKKTSTTR